MIYLLLFSGPLVLNPLVEVTETPKEDGPGRGQAGPKDIRLDEEEAEEDDQEEGNRQWTGYLVKRHLEAIFHKVTGLAVLPVSQHGQDVNQDEDVTGGPGDHAESLNCRVREAENWRDQGE